MDSLSEGRATIGRYRYLALAGAILTSLLIAMGGIVCITGSGNGCPDWPRCYGQVVPPARLESIIEYTHRVVAGLTTPLIVAMAIGGWRRYRRIRWISRPAALAVFTALAVVVFGAFAVLTGLPRGVAALDLGTALLTMALVLTVTVTALTRRARPTLPDQLSWRTPFARLALATLISVYAVLVSGVLVADKGSIARCVGWPIYASALSPDGALAALQAARRILGGLTTLLALAMAARAWRTQRDHPGILAAATLLAVLLLAETVIGVVMVARDLPFGLRLLYAATGTAIWALAVILAVLAGQARAAQPAAASAPPASRRARDLLATTRPTVIILLSVAACAGMVAGARAIPQAATLLWTLLGGALACGGAHAINQYLDRDLDATMERTAKRPLPAGRLSPAEALAWGLGLCAAAIYVLLLFVNGLAALLSLFGILWYVVVYTLLLKRRSAQNVVIGGIAGAMPPLVGWAAATGRLDAAAWWMFAVILLWTPPHFWSLVLLRKADYARAGLPMLPLVRGEAVAGGRIMAYVAALVATSLLLPLGEARAASTCLSRSRSARALLYGAWRVWRQGGAENARRLYRLSSFYLGLLLLALMAGALA